MESKPIRIAQVVGPVLLGGVDTIVMNYYRNIDRSKIQFDFIMDGYYDTPIDDEIKAMGGKVYKVEPYVENMGKSMRQYYRIFNENHYSIVHCHMNTLSVFPLFEAWRAGVPVRIAHSHSTAALGEGKKTVMKQMLRPFSKMFATNYCACSALAGTWQFGSQLYDSGKVKLIKNAVSIERFRYNEEIRDCVRKELGLENKFVVGHVGRFAFQKNHDFLIDIFYEVHKYNPNAVLMMVGEGELKPIITQKVEKLGLTESVVFMGVRQDVPDLMQAMDVFVLPSFYEGLPVVGIEAQSAGLPCILSDAMTSETKITNLASFLSLSQSPKEWADKILCYDSDYTRADTTGEIADAGFEIRTAAIKLQMHYLELSRD